MIAFCLALVFALTARADCPSLESEPPSSFAIGLLCRKLALEYPDEMIGGSLELQIVHCRNKGKFTLVGTRYSFEIPIVEGRLFGSARVIDPPEGAKTPDVILDEPSLG